MYPPWRPNWLAAQKLAWTLGQFPWDLARGILPLSGPDLIVIYRVTVPDGVAESTGASAEFRLGLAGLRVPCHAWVPGFSILLSNPETLAEEVSSWLRAKSRVCPVPAYLGGSVISPHDADE